jgi:hypothetical protein
MGRKSKAAAAGISLLGIWMILMTLSQLVQNIDYAAYALFNIQIPVWVPGLISLVSIPFLIYFLLRGGRRDEG